MTLGYLSQREIQLGNAAGTVEDGLRESSPQIGAFAFAHNGRSYSLLLIGEQTATGVQPVAHIRDRSSGPVTDGAGRAIELKFADDTKIRIDSIDFRYAVALPCTFTNFVTCTVVRPENQLDFQVLAGRIAPATDGEDDDISKRSKGRFLTAVSLRTGQCPSTAERRLEERSGSSLLYVSSASSTSRSPLGSSSVPNCTMRAFRSATK
jgi:hypothetical protein